MTNEETVNFTTRVFNIGQVSVTDVAEFEFPVDNPDAIHYVKGSCGCTNVWFDSAKSAVVGKLTIQSAGKFEPGETPLAKTVTVSLDPAENEFTADAQKRRIPNRNKKTITLNVVGTVVV